MGHVMTEPGTPVAIEPAADTALAAGLVVAAMLLLSLLPVMAGSLLRRARALATLPRVSRVLVAVAGAGNLLDAIAALAEVEAGGILYAIAALTEVEAGGILGAIGGILLAYGCLLLVRVPPDPAVEGPRPASPSHG
jgi:hypothetical protein